MTLQYPLERQVSQPELISTLTLAGGRQAPESLTPLPSHKLLRWNPSTRSRITGQYWSLKQLTHRNQPTHTSLAPSHQSLPDPHQNGFAIVHALPHPPSRPEPSVSCWPRLLTLKSCNKASFPEPATSLVKIADPVALLGVASRIRATERDCTVNQHIIRTYYGPTRQQH